MLGADRHLRTDFRLELIDRKHWARGNRFFIFAELRDVSDGMAFARGDDFESACLIVLKVESAVIDSDQRHKLTAVMFDKEDVAIAYLELGAIGDLHGFAVNGAAE